MCLIPLFGHFLDTIIVAQRIKNCSTELIYQSIKVMKHGTIRNDDYKHNKINDRYVTRNNLRKIGTFALQVFEADSKSRNTKIA